MKTRKAYEKPTLQKVSIRPEDSVLTYCRLVGGGISGGQSFCDQGQPTADVVYPSV